VAASAAALIAAANPGLAGEGGPMAIASNLFLPFPSFCFRLVLAFVCSSSSCSSVQA
jgi:hypothetical protein